MVFNVIDVIIIFMIIKLLICIIIIHFGKKEGEGGRFIKLNRFIIE
jgi:hypothetical protein